jgi:hypothetical protein
MTGMERVASSQSSCAALPEISVSRVPASLILSDGPSSAMASHMHLAHAPLEGSGSCSHPAQLTISDLESLSVKAVPGAVLLGFFLKDDMI